MMINKIQRFFSVKYNSGVLGEHDKLCDSSHLLYIDWLLGGHTLQPVLSGGSSGGTQNYFRIIIIKFQNC
jgi:hypothetical protein